MTERLYYTDSYLSHFKARVIEFHPASNLVYLDKTAFYPTSGGQPHDLGTISGQQLVEVIDEGDRIAHRMAGPLEGKNVECQIEWERRYDHMQQHTGQHLLSAVWIELWGIPTVSFHMGAEASTIELQTKEISEEQIEAAERHANRIAREGRLVSIRFDDACGATGLRKQSERSGLLRIVTIDGFDRSACGGTHVASTSEVAPLQIRRTEKIRGNVRLEFVCGDRAIRRARLDLQIVTELGRMNGVGVDDLPESVGRLQSRLADSEKNRLHLSSEVAHLQASVLYRDTTPDADGIRRASIEAPVIDDTARGKGQAFAGCPKSVLLMVGVERPGVLVACSPDTGMNAGAILRAALAEAGGRGGGTSTLAQGNVSDANALRLLRHKLGFES